MSCDMHGWSSALDTGTTDVQGAIQIWSIAMKEPLVMAVVDTRCIVGGFK
jgi:hypothetical protein